MKQVLSGIFQIAMFRFRNPSQLRGEDYSIGTHLSHLEPGCAETIDGIRLVALLAIHSTVFVDAECMCLYTIKSLGYVAASVLPNLLHQLFEIVFKYGSHLDIRII